MTDLTLTTHRYRTLLGRSGGSVGDEMVVYVHEAASATCSRPRLLRINHYSTSAALGREMIVDSRGPMQSRNTERDAARS